METNEKLLIELAIDKKYLDLIVYLMIDNAELNYKKDGLRITNEDVILQILKQLYPKSYDLRLNELLEKELNKGQIEE